MAKNTKQSYSFRRVIKLKAKPEHLIVGQLTAQVQVICDYENEMAAQRIKLIEKKIEKEGESVLDRYEKMIAEKTKELDETIKKQRKLAEKGAPKAEEPVAKGLKDLNRLISDIESDLGGEVRTSIEKLIKKQKIKVQASSVGMSRMNTVRLEPGLFEGMDDGLDAKEVKSWADLHKSWAKDAAVLSAGSGAGSLTQESDARGQLSACFKGLKAVSDDPKENERIAKEAGAIIKQFAAANAKYHARVKKTLKAVDAKASFVKKQKNEAEPGINKKILLHFKELRKHADELELNLDAGGQIAGEIQKSVTKAAGEDREKVKKLMAQLEKGQTENWRAVDAIEKQQQQQLSSGRSRARADRPRRVRCISSAGRDPSRRIAPQCKGRRRPGGTPAAIPHPRCRRGGPSSAPRQRRPNRAIGSAGFSPVGWFRRHVLPWGHPGAASADPSS